MKMRSPGMARMRLEVDLARQRVEAVEDQADVRMIGAAHDLPGVAVVVDVPAPGERLVADAQAALGRALAEFAEIGGGAVDAAQRHRRDVGADQHQVGAELLHQVELALGPVEGAGALRLRHALEIAERLEQGDLQPEVAHHPRRPRAGVPSKARKSFSKISTPSKPAAAMACELLARGRR